MSDVVAVIHLVGFGFLIKTRYADSIHACVAAGGGKMWDVQEVCMCGVVVKQSAIVPTTKKKDDMEKSWHSLQCLAFSVLKNH